MASGLPKNVGFGSVSSLSTGSSQSDPSNQPYADLNSSQDSLTFTGMSRPEIKPQGAWDKFKGFISSPVGIISAIGVALLAIVGHGCRNSGAWLRKFAKKSSTQTPAQKVWEKFTSGTPAEKLDALKAAQKETDATQHLAMLNSVKQDVTKHSPEFQLEALK